MFSSQQSQVSNDANYIEDVFSTYLYTGTGATQSITNGIDLSTKGGLVWLKYRTNPGSYYNHQLVDTVRGANKSLFSNLTDAQFTTTNGLNSFNSSGFTVGSNMSQSGYNVASWTFRKQAKFFDVVTYSGDGVLGRTVSHSLGSVPGCIIVKKRSGLAANWAVYHRGNGATPQNNYLILNDTLASQTAADRWNNTAPTSTVFTVGDDATVNQSGETYVAYIFAHDAGGFGLTGTDNVISCGAFTTDGTGSATVNLGYEAQYVLFKSTEVVQDWFVVDNMRGLSFQDARPLYPNVSSQEASFGANQIFPTATGVSFTNVLSASKKYIYIAIRRGPMKVPTDATKVFSPVATTFAATTTATTNFPVDLVINTQRSKATVTQNITRDRLRGEVYSTTTGTAAEAATSVTNEFASNTAFVDTYTQSAYGSGINGTNAIYWAWQRAPSFFDEVCYTGTGANTTVTHNLGVVPELMIVKVRSTTAAWVVYSSTLGNTKYLALNQTSSEFTSSTIWNNTTPTSTVFSLGTSSSINGSGQTFVAYLFATCPGVSKIGSYTGTGTTKQVDCGFAAGARFVLIKRTDSTGDWYVWDSARGIVSGNDPYLLLNSTAAEVTNTDYVDTYAAGFEISSTAPAAINASGGTFIFLAIA